MSLPPQYRSKKGRRPPFYPLQQQTHIDDIPIELLELSQCVTLRPYEDGTKEGGVRAWEREHESVIEWLYDGEGSPCLVDPRDPNQHSLYMTEFAFAARNRGQEAIRETYSSLSGLINGDHDFETKYVEPWKALDRKEQEETILKALSEKARNEEDHDSTFLSRTRLLAPEITLDNLCGQGLLDLLKTLAICAIDPSRLSAEPIFNEKVFRKLGIRSEGDLPLSRGDRALQDELLLRRHSVLASLIIAILDEIAGEQGLRDGTHVGNVASDISIENNPTFANSASSTSPGSVHKDYDRLYQETCCLCHSTASRANLKCLLYCAKCKDVARIQTYCSRECQKSDWPRHKSNCGLRLGAFMPIPIPIASTSSLDPVRQLIVRGLDRYTGEFWVTPKPRMAPQGMRCEDKVVEDEIRRGMRRLAYNALREDDAASIAIFAYVVIGDISIHVDRDETGVRVERDARSATPYEKEQQFRAMFNLESEEGWAAVRAQGKNEILKPEYSFAQKLHRLNLQVAKKQRDEMLDSVELVKPGTSDVSRRLAKLVIETKMLTDNGLEGEELYEALCGGFSQDPSTESDGQAIEEKKARKNRKKRERKANAKQRDGNEERV